MTDRTGDGFVGGTYKYNQRVKRNLINELTTYLSIVLVGTSLIWFVLIALNYQPAMNVIENIIAGSK